MICQEDSECELFGVKDVSAPCSEGPEYSYSECELFGAPLAVRDQSRLLTALNAWDLSGVK